MTILTLLRKNYAAAAAAAQYQTNVLTLSPILYMPLNETTGTAATDLGSVGVDGTYTGVTLDAVDGPVATHRAGSWDGANDYVDIYSATLDSTFDGQEGSLGLWCKTDGWGATRRLFQLTRNVNNQIYVTTTTTANQLRVGYIAGAVTELLDTTTLGGTGAWFHVAITWSKIADAVILYINGLSTVTAGTLGTHNNGFALSSTQSVIGALSTTPANVLSGSVAHVALFDSVLTAAQIATLSYLPTYSERALAQVPIAYWKQNETSGTTATNYGSIASGDGTYTGVTLGDVTGPVDGDLAPTFDGANDYTDVYSANLATAFDETSYTVAGWAKITWVGAIRYLFNFGVNGNNIVGINQTATTDELRFLHYAAANTNQVLDTSLSGTSDWFHVAQTVSGGTLKAYINGSQVGADITITGTMASPITDASTVVGAFNETPTLLTTGSIAHPLVLDYAATAEQIQVLANLGPYAQKVMALNPIGYWPLNDLEGTVAKQIGTTDTAAGTYSGVTLDSVASPITGDTAPYLDGVNDRIYNGATFLAVPAMAEGGFGGWMKVVSGWGTAQMIFTARADATNLAYIRTRSHAGKHIDFTYNAAGTASTIYDNSTADSTDWIHVFITYSASNDRVRAYINGVQVGADATGLGVWAGALTSSRAGAFHDNSQPFDGYLSHWQFFDSELTAAQVLTLATAI